VNGWPGGLSGFQVAVAEVLYSGYSLHCCKPWAACKASCLPAALPCSLTYTPCHLPEWKASVPILLLARPHATLRGFWRLMWSLLGYLFEMNAVEQGLIAGCLPQLVCWVSFLAAASWFCTPRLFE
jgi:hypothetical protein